MYLYYSVSLLILYSLLKAVHRALMCLCSHLILYYGAVCIILERRVKWATLPGEYGIDFFRDWSMNKAFPCLSWSSLSCQCQRMSAVL